MATYKATHDLMARLERLESNTAVLDRSVKDLKPRIKDLEALEPRVKHLEQTSDGWIHVHQKSLGRIYACPTLHVRTRKDFVYMILVVVIAGLGICKVQSVFRM